MAVDPEVKLLIERASRAAANSAVKQTLLTLGIDASNPRAIRESQRDQAYLRRIRVLTEVRGAKYWVIVFGTIMSVVGAVLTTLAHQMLGR